MTSRFQQNKKQEQMILKIEDALQSVSLHRADLGAMINRLQFNIENLNSQSMALTNLLHLELKMQTWRRR